MSYRPDNLWKVVSLLSSGALPTNTGPSTLDTSLMAHRGLNDPDILTRQLDVATRSNEKTTEENDAEALYAWT